MPDTASSPCPGNGQRIVLAYSGGLDTTVIASWLIEQGWEVITFTADLGQGEEVEPARLTAQALGIKNIYIEDLRERFAAEFVLPMFRANALYEGEYLLGTSIARPLVAERLVEIARECGAVAVAHGATGKGNDQVRFELGVRALAPDLEVIAPWRIWSFDSRQDLVAYCREHQLPVNLQGDRPPWSMDANLLHISYEGGVLEDPDVSPPEEMWQRTRNPQQAPQQPLDLAITFSDGDPVAVDGVEMPPHSLIERLNKCAGEHGIGRSDIVENRMVGMKSRGCYETPGGTILAKARRAMESITLDAQLGHLKDSLMPEYTNLVYEGLWFAPERHGLQALMDYAAKNVSGEVRVRLYKGSVQVLGRSSSQSLYDGDLASFDGDHGYRQADAEGYIRIRALRLQALNRRRQKGN